MNLHARPICSIDIDGGCAPILSGDSSPDRDLGDAESDSDTSVVGPGLLVIGHGEVIQSISQELYTSLQIKRL